MASLRGAKLNGPLLSALYYLCPRPWYIEGPNQEHLSKLKLYSFLQHGSKFLWMIVNYSPSENIHPRRSSLEPAPAGAPTHGMRGIIYGFVTNILHAKRTSTVGKLYIQMLQTITIILQIRYYPDRHRYSWNVLHCHTRDKVKKYFARCTFCFSRRALFCPVQGLILQSAWHSHYSHWGPLSQNFHARRTSFLSTLFIFWTMTCIDPKSTSYDDSSISITYMSSWVAYWDDFHSCP